MSALRRAQWPVKYEAIRSAFVRDGVNPATGRKCKLHKCSDCGELFPAKDMRADHIDPIVPVHSIDVRHEQRAISLGLPCVNVQVTRFVVVLGKATGYVLRYRLE